MRSDTGGSGGKSILCGDSVSIRRILNVDSRGRGGGRSNGDSAGCCGGRWNGSGSCGDSNN